MRAQKAPRVWQRMLSGRRLNLVDPSPLDIELTDIAHGLARVARWNGQTSGDHIFSVAQHSLLVEELAAHLYPALGSTDRLAILLHDSAEYVIGDMISPFKALIGVEYTRTEDRLMQAIHLRFGLPAARSASLTRQLKRADKAAAWIEATMLAGFSRDEATAVFGQPVEVPVSAQPLLTPRTARDMEAAFLERTLMLLPCPSS